MSRIVFYDLKSVRFLKNRKHFKEFLHSVFIEEGKLLNSLNIVLCDDEYLLSINKEFLQHDYYTDIITFDLSNDTSSIEGELYISIERVIDNAEKIVTNKVIELHRVIFHGCLHLCGYRDKSSKEKSTMRSKEDYYIQKYLNNVI
jgi:rRNA maturation RNase YbeY